MFFGCYSLKVLNISNFNFTKVKYLNGMFYGCSSLKEIIISNFNVNNDSHMNGMLVGCSEDLKREIITKCENIKEKAFNL